MLIKVRTFQDVIDSHLDYIMSDENGNEIENPNEWSWSLIEVLDEMSDEKFKFVFKPFMLLR